jgi:hypothetical protein
MFRTLGLSSVGKGCRGSACGWRLCWLSAGGTEQSAGDGQSTRDVVLTIIARIGTPGGRSRPRLEEKICHHTDRHKSAGVSTPLQGQAASFARKNRTGADINVNAIRGGVQRGRRSPASGSKAAGLGFNGWFTRRDP